jgi:hypothetical protein
VSLIVGMLSGSAGLFDRAEAVLAERFGKPSCASGVMKFDFTAYYEPEMGANLLRKFIAFERPVNPADLAEIKLWTNAVETSFSEAAASQRPPVRRPINLDPGYVTPSKLVLATTKDHAHRIYLDRGIYAEVTLRFLKGAFEPMPWTYPDYCTEAYRRFFKRVRAELLARQKAGRL